MIALDNRINDEIIWKNKMFTCQKQFVQFLSINIEIERAMCVSSTLGTACTVHAARPTHRHRHNGRHGSLFFNERTFSATKNTVWTKTTTHRQENQWRTDSKHPSNRAPPPRAIRFSKIFYDFCNHLNFHLKRPGRSIRS